MPQLGARPEARGTPAAPRPTHALASILGGRLSGQPFAPAQRAAQKRVERATPRPTPPHIPVLPNPTPRQVQAAHEIAVHYQRSQLPRNASGAQMEAFKRELGNTPEGRAFQRSVAHYEAHGERLRAAYFAQKGLLSPAAPPGIRGKVRPGNAPSTTTLPLAEIKLPTGAIGAAISNAVAKATPGLQVEGPEAEVFRSIPEDIAAGASFPVVAGYQLMRGYGELQLGKPGRLIEESKQIASGISHGFLGSAVKGETKQAEEALRHHLLLSLVESEGIRSAIMRPAGSVARALGSTPEAAGARGALARLGNRVRPPVALSKEPALARKGYVRQRTYSGDPGRKLVQKLLNGEPMVDAQGRPVTTYDRGRQVQVTVPRGKQAERFQQRRANFEAQRKQGMERQARQEALTTTLIARARPGGKITGKLPAPLQYDLRAAVPGRLTPVRVAGQRAPMTAANISRSLSGMVSSGAIRSVKSFEADLAKRIDTVDQQIKDPTAFRTEDELRAAKEQLALLRRAQESPRILGAKRQIVKQGLQQAAALNKVDPNLVGEQVRPAAEVHRGRLSEYALAHMNATHFTEVEHVAAERAARAAGLPRHEQIAVSGRNPVGVVAHERAAKASSLADLTERQARARIAGLEKRLGAKNAAARRSRGSGESMKPIRREDAKAKYDLESKLKDARGAHKVARKAKTQAAHEVRKNPLPPINPALRTREGKILTNEAIEAHARAAGRNPDTLAYLPHRVEATSRRSYHRQFRVENRPVTQGTTRTGHLFERGANSIHSDLFRDELTHKQTVLAQTQQIDKVLGESTIVHPAESKAAAGEDLTPREQEVLDKHGGIFNSHEAQEFADRYNAAHPENSGAQLVPVRLHAGKLPKGMQQAIREKQSPLAMEGSHLALLNDRLDTGVDRRVHNVGLISRAHFDQLQRHLLPPGELDRFAQLAVGPFRMAVLPQPKWLTGNFLEPYVVRLPLSGSGVFLPGLAVDLRATSRFLRSLDKGGPEDRALAAELHTQLGGLFIGSRGAVVRRTFEDFSGRTRSVLYGAHVVRNLPVLKPLGDLALAIPKSFFHINRLIEGTAQRAAFGHQLRQEISTAQGSWLKGVAALEPALQEAKRGLYNTAAQHRFLEAQHELLGQYDAWSPFLKRMMQGYTPFLPWTLAAMRFVFWTLPAHHTVAFTAAMKLAQSVMPEWEAQHADAPPGELRFDPRTEQGGFLNLVRDTPFGATIPIAQGIQTGDPTQLSGFVSQVAPYLSGIHEAAGGRDPFGRALEVPKTPSNPKGKATFSDVLQIIGRDALESGVPLLGLAGQVAAGGGTPYANSMPWAPKTKPNTKHESGLERALNPVREIRLKPKKGNKGATTAFGTLQQARAAAEGGASRPGSAFALLQKERAK